MAAFIFAFSAPLPQGGRAVNDRYPSWQAGRYGLAGPLDSGLYGTGRVADDLYLMAHDDATGKPLLEPRGLGLGVAGGLLAELMLGRSVGLLPDGTVAAGRTRPADELAQRILGLVAAEQPLAVRDWLGFLALTAPHDVARRLGQAGYLAQARRRLPWRQPRWVPVDPDWAFAPLLRVRSALDPSRPFSAPAAALAGLAAACGLRFRIDQYLAPGCGIAEATRPLPADLRELIAQTQAAADSSVLFRRT
jgi:Golgi phosphoprotein 3 (GPP34)